MFFLLSLIDMLAVDFFSFLLFLVSSPILMALEVGRKLSEVPVPYSSVFLETYVPVFCR